MPWCIGIALCLGLPDFCMSRAHPLRGLAWLHQHCALRARVACSRHAGPALTEEPADVTWEEPLKGPTITPALVVTPAQAVTPALVINPTLVITPATAVTSAPAVTLALERATFYCYF